MFYLALVAVALLHLGLGSHIHLLGGGEYIVPTLLILTASQGWWRQWLLWLAVLGLVSFYDSLSPVLFILVIFGSIVAFVVFKRWVDHDTVWAGVLVAGLLVGLVTSTALFALSQTVSWAMVGSFLLSLPLIIGWYVWLAAQRSST